MVTMAAQEVKRRGISAMNEGLSQGPVWVISNNTPKYVVMYSEAYKQMEDELCCMRVALSEAQARAGLVKRGTADDLMAELAD